MIQKSTKCAPAILMFGLRTPVDLVFGPLPEPELEGAPGQEYLHSLREWLQLVYDHDQTRKALSDTGLWQKRVYDSHCNGQDFSPGEHVWVSSPERKKGLSPKLMSQWVGPFTVPNRLSDMVYRVHMIRRKRVVVLHHDRLAP